MVVLIILGYLFYDKIVSPKVTGLQIAIESASFIDKTLQPDGSMLAGFGCVTSTHKCEPIEVKNDAPHLGQAIYGLYLLAKLTGEESYRVRADKAMNYVLAECETNVQMCAWNFFPLARYYFDTKEDKYLQGMLQPAELFLNMSSREILQQNVGHKLASLYQATNDNRYKVRLLEVAEDELANWPNKPAHSIQVIWSVFMPAYNITNDKKYLVASENFLDGYSLLENFEQINPIQTVLKGVDGLLSVAEVSEHGEIYKAEARVVLERVAQKLWDNPQSPKINGDYGFLDEASTSSKVQFKMTINNGWFVKLFAMMADEKFKLVITP